jgi:hypothetical protein
MPDATTSGEAATRDGIRNPALSYGDEPLYTNFDYVKHTRWGAQIAAQMMMNCLSNPTCGDPLPDELRKQTTGLFSGVHVVVSGQSSEWYRPIYIGDELYGFGGIESVEENCAISLWR